MEDRGVAEAAEIMRRLPGLAGQARTRARQA
jgi:hypothetical protein